MTIPTAPHTQTITLNADDHPVIIYAVQDEAGRFHWAFQIRKPVMDNRDVMREVLLDLNRASAAWFTGNYSPES